MGHTRESWRTGTETTGYGRHAVVTDCPPSCKCDKATIEAYGGHLICESVEPHRRHIISAAPDMLEALRELMAEVQSESGVVTYPTGQKALAAIAKAEGK